MSKVKVRIPVEVQPSGYWFGMASSDEPEDEAMRLLDPRSARYWLEAELDVPVLQKITTIQSTVTPE